MRKRKGNKSVKGNKGNAIIDNEDNVNTSVAAFNNEVGDPEPSNITELNDVNTSTGSLKRRKVENASAGADTESVSSSSTFVLKMVPNNNFNELNESDDGTEIPDEGQSAGEESDDETQIDDAAKKFCLTRLPMWFLCMLTKVGCRSEEMSTVDGANMVELTRLSCTRVIGGICVDTEESTLADVYTVGFVKIVEYTKNLQGDTRNKFKFRRVDQLFDRNNVDTSEEDYVAYAVTPSDVYDYFKFCCNTWITDASKFSLNIDNGEMLNWSHIQMFAEQCMSSTFDILKLDVSDIIDVKRKADEAFHSKHNGYLGMFIADGQHRLYVLGSSLYETHLFGDLRCVKKSLPSYKKLMHRPAMVRVIDFNEHVGGDASIPVALSREISSHWNMNNEASVNNHMFAIVPVLLGMINVEWDNAYNLYAEEVKTPTYQMSSKGKWWVIPKEKYFCEIGGYDCVKNRRNCLYRVMSDIISQSNVYHTTLEITQKNKDAQVKLLTNLIDTQIKDSINPARSASTKIICKIMEVLDGVISFRDGPGLLKHMIASIEGMTWDNLHSIYTVANGVGEMLCASTKPLYDLMVVRMKEPHEKEFNLWKGGPSGNSGFNKYHSKYKRYFTCIVFEDLLHSAVEYCLMKQKSNRILDGLLQDMPLLNDAIKEEFKKPGLSFRSYMLFVESYGDILEKTIFDAKYNIFEFMKHCKDEKSFNNHLQQNGTEVEKWLYDRSCCFFNRQGYSTQVHLGLKDYFPNHMVKGVNTKQVHTHLEKKVYSSNVFLLPKCLSVQSVLFSILSNQKPKASLDILSKNESKQRVTEAELNCTWFKGNITESLSEAASGSDVDTGNEVNDTSTCEGDTSTIPAAAAASVAAVGSVNSFVGNIADVRNVQDLSKVLISVAKAITSCNVKDVDGFVQKMKEVVNHDLFAVLEGEGVICCEVCDNDKV